MARTGKIARLPAIVREQLNRRMLNGEAAKPLLEWLNGLEDTQRLLNWQFKGAPISEQNLSEWRQGGHQEFLRQEDACDFLKDLDEENYSYSVATDERPVGELIAARAAVELAKVSQALLTEATDAKERWRLLKELLPHLAQMRRSDQRAARVEMQKEQHEWEQTAHEREEFAREVRVRQAEAREAAWAAKTAAAEGGIKPNQT